MRGETTVVPDTTQHNAIASTTARIGMSTMSRYSFAASAATTHASTRSGRRGRKRIATSAAVASATPLTRRVIGSLRADDGSRADSAVSPVALLIREDRFDEVPTPEIGPQSICHVDLRIRDLPQQVIADAHFAAGADEEIRIGLTGRVEKTREPLFVENFGTHTKLDGASRRIDDFGAAAVVERDVEQHPAAVACAFDRDIQFVLNVGCPLLHPSDHAKANVVAQERIQFRSPIPLQETHERTDLAGRTLPVLDGKCVERQDTDA